MIFCGSVYLMSEFYDGGKSGCFFLKNNKYQ